MSPLLIAALIVLLGFVFAQFGGRLAARHSATWALVSAFLLMAAIRPQFLQPLAQFFGITLVSNLVFAVLTMFLFVQMLEQYAETARSGRQLVQLVSVLAVREFRPREELAAPPKVLVVLPCFNEAENVRGILDRIFALCNAHPEFDFCVVDDGSTDSTADLLAERAPRNHLRHATNAGVAAVLRTGFQLAVKLRATYVVQCDSDGQHPVEQIPQLVQVAQERNADLLIASRFARRSATSREERMHSTTRWRRAGAMVVCTVLRLFGRDARVSDPTSGFRVYSAKAVSSLLHWMPDEYPEPESIAVAALRRLRIEESTVIMVPRTAGRSSLAGLKSVRYMVKVIAALLGLRLRTLLGDLQRP